MLRLHHYKEYIPKNQGTGKQKWWVRFSGASNNHTKNFKNNYFPFINNTPWKISYFLNDKNNEILSFVFNDNQFEVEFSLDFYECIIPEQIPHASLLKIFDKVDEITFEKAAQNYFFGLSIDHLDYQLNDVVIANYWPEIPVHENTFFIELSNILNQHNIKLYILLYSCWPRDLISPQGPRFLLHPFEFPSEKTAFYYLGLEENSYATIPFFKNYLPVSGNGFRNKWQDKRLFLKNHCYMKQLPFKEKKVIVEEGNALTIYNNNKIFMVIGKPSAILTAYFRLEKGYSDKNIHSYTKLPEGSNKKFYKLLQDREELLIKKEHIKEAKQAIAKSLRMDPNNIIWIPNPSYHIDIMLAPGPNGIIFLNSFPLIIELAKKIIFTHKEALEIACLTALIHKKTKHIFLKIKEKIQAKGIPVIDVPGVIFGLDNENKLIMKANFINAIYARGRGGNLHVCLSYDLPIFLQEFKKILKNNGVDFVHFVGSTAFRNELLTEGGGSLRCVTTNENLYRKKFSSALFSLPTPHIKHPDETLSKPNHTY